MEEKVKIKIGRLKSVKIDKNELFGAVQTGKMMPISERSKWSWLRKHFPKVDAEIKKAKKEDEYDFNSFFLHKFGQVKDQRELQYIIKKGINQDEIIAIATMGHSLIKQEKIYEIVKTTAKKMKLSLTVEQGMLGKIIYLKKTKIANLGLQVYAGSITTQYAIKITNFAVVLQCLNPLSFLNINRGVLQPEKELAYKILRFEKLSKIPTRIEEAITQLKPSMEKLEENLMEGKKIKVSETQAKKIMCCMGSAYGIGLKVLQEVEDDFEKKKDKNLWELSMSASYVVAHKQEVFRANSWKVSNNLSTIAGAMLLLRDIPKAVQKCDDRMKVDPVAKDFYKKIV